MQSESDNSTNQMSTIMALDTNLLAWVRTALSLLGCGFTLAKIVHDLSVSGPLTGLSSALPRYLGIGLMTLGVICLLGGISQYITVAKRISANLGPPIALIVTVGLTVISLWLIFEIVTTLN